MKNNKPKIHFIGGGAWGQALAKTLILSDFEVSILVSDKLRIENLKKNVKVDAYVEQKKLKNAEIIFITTESFRVEKSLEIISRFNPTAKIILTSKGFASEQGETFPEMLQKKFPNIIFAGLTGPTYAS